MSWQESRRLALGVLVAHEQLVALRMARMTALLRWWMRRRRRTRMSRMKGDGAAQTLKGCTLVRV
jgi:hypothetical protein